MFSIYHEPPFLETQHSNMNHTPLQVRGFKIRDFKLQLGRYKVAKANGQPEQVQAAMLKLNQLYSDFQKIDEEVTATADITLPDGEKILEQSLEITSLFLGIGTEEDSTSHSSSAVNLGPATTSIDRASPFSFKPNVPKPAKFKGNVTETNEFLRDFEAYTVALTPGEKLAHLKSLTDGVAREAIEPFLVGGGDEAVALRSALTCLGERFGEDDLVAVGLLQRLEDWPTLEPGDGGGLQALVDFLRYLEALMPFTPSLSIIDTKLLNRKISSKLPPIILDKWISKFINLSEFPPFSEFVKFLVSEVKISNHSFHKPSPLSTGSSTSNSTHPNTRPSVSCFATHATTPQSKGSGSHLPSYSSSKASSKGNGTPS